MSTFPVGLQRGAGRSRFADAAQPLAQAHLIDMGPSGRCPLLRPHDGRWFAPTWPKIIPGFLNPQRDSLLKKLLAIAALALPTLALANSNCDKPINDFDGLYCLNKVYGEADKELNERYQELVPLLDAPGKAALKRGQIAWMKQRNSQCSRREGNSFFV